MNEFDEEKQVHKWYQQGANEQPSAELDSEIINFSRENTPAPEGDKPANDVTHSTSHSEKKKPFMQRYQWQFGVAASVLVASLVYVQHSSEFDAPTVQVESRTAQADISSFELEESAEIAAQSAYTHHAPRANKASPAEKAKVVTKEIKKEAKQFTVAKIQPVETRSREKAVKSATIAKKQTIAEQQTPYQLTKAQQTKLDTLFTQATQKNQTPLQQVKSTAALFNVVYAIKAVNPHWQVPQKYTALFSQEQLGKLANIRQKNAPN